MQQMASKTQFAFSRLRVSFSLEDVDYDAQIRDCINKIQELENKLTKIHEVNSIAFSDI